MKSYLGATYAGIVGASSKEIVGALLIGLALALLASGLARLARRKLADPGPILCVATLVACVLSMALGLGYERHRANLEGLSLSKDDPKAGFRILPPPIGRRLVHDADLDRDGHLTPEEAARFVRAADSASKGWADAREFDRIRRPWIAPRSIQDSEPDDGPGQDSAVANQPFEARAGDTSS